MSERLLQILMDSFPKILLPGLTVTIPLTTIAFTFAMIIAVTAAMGQYAKLPVLTQLCRFYIWIFRGTPLLVQLAAAVLCVSALTTCSQNAGQPTNPTSNPDSGNSSQRSAPADLLAQIQERGEIVVAMGGTWAPWTYHDESDQLVGYDAESYGAEVTGVDDFIQTIELLNSGRIDATLNAEVSFYDYMAQHPEANIKIACIDPASTQVAIPMRKGEESASLVAAINEALAEMAEDGTLTELSMKYFGTDISQEQ